MGNFLVIDVSFKNPIHRKEFYEYTSNAFCMFSWLVKFEYLADGSNADCSNKILKYMLTCRLLEKNPQLQIAWKEKLVRFCWFPHEALECHRREPKKNTLFNLFMYTYWITDWLWKLPFRNKLMLTDNFLSFSSPLETEKSYTIRLNFTFRKQIRCLCPL